eukprot:262404-Pyramimonas_sp.AAC.1
MRQAGASDVSESIPVITSPAAPVQPEISAERRQSLRRTRTIRISLRTKFGQQTEFGALNSKGGRA